MLKQRALTAVIAVILLLGVLFVAPVWLARLVIAAVFLAGAWEWSGFFTHASRPARAGFVAIVALAEAGLWLVLPEPAVYRAIVFAAVAWWAVALIWIFLFPTGIPSAVRWLAGILVLLPAYVAIDWLYLQSPPLLLALLIIVWLADIGAYFAGRAFGRVKLAPEISPGKTWEGVIGGLLAVTAAASVAAYATDYGFAILIPFTLAVALISVVGDLTVSMFKRTAGVKDSGALFPGHGGVLDRIDSVCAAAPLFAVGLAALGPAP